MTDLGPHGGYIIASYLIASVSILAVVIVNFVQYRALKHEVRNLEERGVMRKREDES